jgi:hypothetical protein
VTDGTLLNSTWFTGETPGGYQLYKLGIDGRVMQWTNIFKVSLNLVWIAIMMALLVATGARAQIVKCEGILRQNQEGGLFFQVPPEGLCEINPSQQGKVLATCTPGQFCLVEGIAEDYCKDSGECSEITRVISSATVSVQSEKLPTIVQAEIDQAKSACAPNLAVLAPGFIVQKDINGDGTKDYILDYVVCGENAFFFCGSAGCLMQVFASRTRGNYVKVIDENVRNVQFRTIKGRFAMVIDLHGSTCGRAGAAPCSMTLFWNGRTFSPAN